MLRIAGVAGLKRGAQTGGAEGPPLPTLKPTRRWPQLAQAHKVPVYGAIPALPMFILFEKGKEVGRIPHMYEGAPPGCGIQLWALGALLQVLRRATRCASFYSCTRAGAAHAPADSDGWISMASAYLLQTCWPMSMLRHAGTSSLCSMQSPTP